MKSSVGTFDLDVPRDRNSSFEPEIIKKHQTHISEQLEQKIYAELFTLRILLNQSIDSLENSLKQKVLFQMKTAC